MLEQLNARPDISNWKVVVVNDGSTDETVSRARAILQPDRLEILSHERNLGLGAACQTAFRHLSSRLLENDVVVTLDADDTHPIAILPPFLRSLEAGAEVVIGSRFTPLSEVHGVPFLRRCLTRGAAYVLRIAFPYENLRDYTSGARAMSGTLLRNAWKTYGPAIVQENGFAATAELLLKLLCFRPKVAEVPLHLHYERKATKSKIAVIPTVLAYVRLVRRMKGKPPIE